jgi:hypothetical protein
VVALAAITDAGVASVGWVRAALSVALPAVGRRIEATVTPVSTVAVVAAVAATCLGVSQFLDYHGVAVGARQYQGEVGVTAPVPIVDKATAGSAHSYLLLPVAAAALVLIALTALGRWRLGRMVAGLGLVGLIVSVAVDVPHGLDAGTAGVSFAGADAELLKGFWLQLTCSAVLLMCGLLLAAHVRAASAAAEGSRRRPPTPSGPSEADRRGGLRPPWEARA